MPDERIQYLIENLQEGLDVEVKNWLGGIQDNAAKAALAKEIIALANNGGGYIFIGFEDEGEGHPEIEAQPNELEAFTQDTVSSIVERYTAPSCQCTLGIYSRGDSPARHPVIVVPGEHRTPVWAKRASPDQQTLQTGVVYVRRPGGASEPARTQDDWEKLLERLVRARQSDQLNAIREIMNPSQERGITAPDLAQWHDESIEIWRQLIEPLQAGDGRRLEQGYWTFSFEIDPFENPSLADLNQFLERESPRYSGWRPFTYLNREPSRPTPHGDEIRAWLASSHQSNELVERGDHSDFWRMSLDGKGFLIRPMQEDDGSYLSNRTPRPEGPSFDWTLPIYRMTELLKFVEALALKFGDENAQYSVLLKYYGMDGRKLQQHNLSYNLWSTGRCIIDTIETRKSGVVAEIGLNLEEAIYALLKPVYEQFEFTDLPKLLVDNVVREALDYG